MSLHLIECPLDLRRLHLWAGTRGLAGGRGFDEGLALHHLLGEVFGPAMMQPFRLLVAPRAQTGTLYAYSQMDAEGLQCAAAATAAPSAADVIAPGRLRSLPRPVAAWREGQLLGFDIRLRPVVRLASELHGETRAGVPVQLGKGAETDAFLAASLRGEQATREDVYLDWLGARLDGAADLMRETTRLAQFARRRVIRGRRSVEGPDAVVHGSLTITDPAAFAALLARGVGRHRSYGYGMLLLRPPQRRNRC